MSTIPSSSNYDSYPPFFRPTSFPNQVVDQQDDDPPSPPGPLPFSDDPLPVIDFQSLHNQNHDEEEEEDDGEEQEEDDDDGLGLAEACKDWGIFRLVNHGVPQSLTKKLHELAKEVFSVSFESKQSQGFGSPMAYFWGTPGPNPAGVPLERAPGDPYFNWIEGFNVPLTRLSLLQTQDPLLHTFRGVLDEYGRHQSRIATTVFKAMAEKLKLGLDGQQYYSWKKKYRNDYLSPPTGFLNVYRYPRCSHPKQPWGILPHTDSSVLSIINHDDVGGFQVYKDRQWLDVKPVPDTLVVNLGDMMQVMSDDKYKSVEHRVKANKHKDRISIGYFVFPAEDSVIHSSKYKPFTYADFRAQVQHDLRTVGFKVGLDWFRLSNTSQQ